MSFCIDLSLLSLQYKGSDEDLKSVSYCVSVWNWDTYGQHELVGGIVIPPLREVDTSRVARSWYNLNSDLVNTYNFSSE